MGTISSRGDQTERLEVLQARFAEAQALKTRLRKLNVALGRVAILDSPRAKLVLIENALAYAGTLEAPLQIRSKVKCIQNELQSLAEGVAARNVRPADLVLTSGVQAVEAVNTYMQGLHKIILSVQGNLGFSENDESVLRKNAKYREALKPFGEKQFQVARVPVSFTFVNKQKHSSVGYVDNARLDMLGFKSANLGGYTVLYDQLVVGIAPHAIFDRIVDEETGVATLQRKKVKESYIKFQKNKPVPSTTTRPKEFLDMLEPIKAKLEAKTNQAYTVMSERPANVKGVEGSWFWLMPTRDVKRLASVFPGGFFKTSQWGFAF